MAISRPSRQNPEFGKLQDKHLSFFYEYTKEGKGQKEEWDLDD